MGYFQVNALSEWIIWIHLHKFTNNERDISIPHEATECGIENFEFIVGERVQINPDDSRVMSALTLSQPKPWCNDSGVLNLHHGYYTTIYDVKEVVSS